MKRPSTPNRGHRPVTAMTATDRPAPVVPATEPLPSDVTAALAPPATEGAAVGSAIADALAAGVGQNLSEPLVKVDGTVPLPFDQLTPLLPAGEALEHGAAYQIDIRDGVVIGLTRIAAPDLARLLGDIRFELGLDAGADAEGTLDAVRLLVRRHAELDALLPLDELEELADMPLSPSLDDGAERRGFPVAFHVDHNGKSVGPGDTVWITQDQHDELYRGTAIVHRWELGAKEEPA